jgi:hypothetical protein
VATFAAAFAAGMVTFATTASAQQCECPTPGQVICCPGQSLTDFQHAGFNITLTATTNGCFMITSCTPPPPSVCPWEVQMSLQNFDGTGTDPNLGTVHWRNDPTRTSTGSTIRALNAGAQFPAYASISFYAQAEIDGIPGVYRSTEEIFIEDPQAMSFNPFHNETFTRPAGAAPVIFTNDVTGDVITLTNLTSILN